MKLAALGECRGDPLMQRKSLASVESCVFMNPGGQRDKVTGRMGMDGCEVSCFGFVKSAAGPFMFRSLMFSAAIKGSLRPIVALEAQGL